MFNVAIIDDEPWSREVVKALAEWDELGLRVDGEAEDGTEGLQLVEERRPHIVITDMRMPGLDGVGLLKRMNEQFPKMKIIVMSGYDDFVYLKQAIRSRAVEYLLKPLDRDELNAALALCAEELRRAEGAPPREPFALSDPAEQERYAAIRQRMQGCLLELDKASALETLEKLGEWIGSLSESRQAYVKAGHDFLSLLEEFAAENELDVSGLRPRASSGEWASPDQAIGELQAMYGEAIDEVESILRRRQRLDVTMIREHIDRHYSEPVSLETLAQRFHVSKEHLSRAFKSQTGENLSDYIVRKRMEKAGELMLEGKLAIKHAARLAGYEDLAYFYRVFKKHYGVTPGDYAKKDDEAKPQHQ